MAENIRIRLEEYTFSNTLTITASFGIAQFSSDDTTSSLIDKADCALYSAKEKGRNRVITSTRCDPPAG
jgi:diguanylate cyclase (GGDEF)-like protein